MKKRIFILLAILIVVILTIIGINLYSKKNTSNLTKVRLADATLTSRLF